MTPLRIFVVHINGHSVPPVHLWPSVALLSQVLRARKGPHDDSSESPLFLFQFPPIEGLNHHPTLKLL